MFQFKLRKGDLVNFQKLNNIIGNATLLFSKHGTQSISMDDIASHCGISKKTIYVYFESKEILIKEIVQMLLAESTETLDTIQNISSGPLVEMEHLFDNIQKTIKTLTPFLIREIKQYYPNIYLFFLQFQENTIIPFVIQNIKRGINENIYRDNLDSESVSLLYCWQLQNIFESTSVPMAIDKLLTHTNKLFLQGITLKLLVAL